MKSNKYNRLRVLSLIVIVYMLLAVLWWSYLLYLKNNDAFQAKVELMKLTQAARGEVKDLATFELHPDYLMLKKQYKKQERMILSEATVLAISLIIGVWFINRGYQRQVEAAAQSRNFLLSITHELKSPIASIRLILQTFSKRNLPQQQVQSFSQNALQETNRLETLVNNLLLAARLETTQAKVHREEVDLYPLLDGIRENILTKQPQTIIKLNVEEDVVLSADPKGLQSVFLNLMENSIKYSDNPAKLTVTHRKTSQHDIIEIADEGWGIPDTEKTKIFDKFYRIGNEDTRKSKGTGLGLHIVKQIINAHGGKIFAKNNSPKGTIFVIHF